MSDEIIRLIEDLKRRVEALETGEVTGLDWDKTWTDAVHAHSSDAEGGQLDWDNIWTDAVHSHASAAEGGTLAQDAVEVSKLVASDGAPDPALSADASGYLSAAVQPLFMAHVSSTITNVTGAGTTYPVVFGTEIYDRNGNFNTANGTFTAPVTAKYLFELTILCSGITAAATLGWCRVMTSNRPHYGSYRAVGAVQSAGYCGFHCSTIADMDILDTATGDIDIAGEAGDTIDVYGAATSFHSYFCAYLLS